MVVWKTKKSGEQKFKLGHPWVYSNEIEHITKGVTPGVAVKLVDSSGGFLAWGFGNPQSQIAFRELSREISGEPPFHSKFVAERLNQSFELRKWLGLETVSHRLVFGEADGFSGLIIDSYALAHRDPKARVFVVQAQSAGMNSFLPQILEGLKIFSEANGAHWEHQGVVIKNDSKMRLLEGLNKEAAQIFKSIAEVDFQNCEVKIKKSASRQESLIFKVNLVSGQKTGFFLDQANNVEKAIQLFSAKRSNEKKVKLLDLCCYVGQWSAQFSAAFKSEVTEVETHLVDVSQTALDLATANVVRAGGQPVSHKLDVLTELSTLPQREFDVVICDPPAFIKNKKDLGPGQHAYVKMNESAMRLVKTGGLYVGCSCSGLLSDEEFRVSLLRASKRAGRKITWVDRGSLSPDHPMKFEFSEGTYLKSYFGVVIE